MANKRGKDNNGCGERITMSDKEFRKIAKKVIAKNKKALAELAKH